jgi:hypothetical protein
MKKLFERIEIRDEVDGKPYLIRWRILGHHIKLHKFLKSDKECLHDHPWAFISIIIKGSYTEYTPSGNKKYKSPCILYRPAIWKHRLEIDECKAAWSIVINFRKVRSWGFWTKTGFVNWRRYKLTGRCD